MGTSVKEGMPGDGDENIVMEEPEDIEKVEGKADDMSNHIVGVLDDILQGDIVLSGDDSTENTLVFMSGREASRREKEKKETKKKVSAEAIVAIIFAFLAFTSVLCFYFYAKLSKQNPLVVYEKIIDRSHTEEISLNSTEGETNPTTTEPEETTTKPESTTTEPEETTTKPAPTTTESASTTTEPEQATTEPEEAKPEPTTTKLEQVATKPEPTMTKPEEAKPEPTPSRVVSTETVRREPDVNIGGKDLSDYYGKLWTGKEVKKVIKAYKNKDICISVVTRPNDDTYWYYFEYQETGLVPVSSSSIDVIDDNATYYSSVYTLEKGNGIEQVGIKFFES